MVNDKQKIIVARIIGGLGNQMFQYACGRAASLRSDAQLLLDISAFSHYRLHNYGLNKFAIQTGKAPLHLQTGSLLLSGLKRLGLTSSRQLAWQGYEYIVEPADLVFESRVMTTHHRSYFEGYWQNEAYFLDAADHIRAEFRQHHPKLTLTLPTMKDKGMPLVSLHIRRGDYVNNPTTTAVHGVLGLDYYHHAVEYLSERIGKDFHVLVFSDDIEWTRQNLALTQPVSFVSGRSIPHEDMLKMAFCDHHIIANSSFSWWGAWLNPSATKVVVCPKNWFVSPQLAHRQICPPTWEQI